MLVNRQTLPQHWRWIVAVTGIGLASIAFYLLYAAQATSGRWPGGSSLPGILFGAMAAAIILFEFLLWPRKWPQVRAWRIGKTQVWMRAHIWLGLLSAPLVVLHHGLAMEWGGLLTWLLMLSFWGVILSGVLGLYLQQVLPSYMLHSLPAESIYSQLPSLSGQMVSDAEQLLSEVSGMRVGAGEAEKEDGDEVVRHVVVGAVRSIGNVKGKVLETQSTDRKHLARDDSAKLVQAFDHTIRPYLVDGARSQSPIKNKTQSMTFFSSLEGSVSPEAREMVETLREFSDTRRQFDQQARVHRLLHGWMSIHLPLSVALVLLLLTHIVTAVWYAGIWPMT